MFSLLYVFSTLHATSMHVRSRAGDLLSLATTSVEICILHYRVLQIYNLVCSLFF